MPREPVRHSFWVCPGGCFQKRLACELVDGVKKSILSPSEGIPQSIQGLASPKRWRKGKSPLYLSWDVHLFLLSVISTLALGSGLTPSAAPALMPSDSGWRTPLTFPGSPPCGWKIVRVLASITEWAHSYSKSPLMCVHLYVSYWMFLWEPRLIHGLTIKGHDGIWGVMEMFCVLIMTRVAWVCPCVNIHRPEHLKLMGVFWHVNYISVK